MTSISRFVKRSAKANLLLLLGRLTIIFRWLLSSSPVLCALCSLPLACGCATPRQSRSFGSQSRRRRVRSARGRTLGTPRQSPVTCQVEMKHKTWMIYWMWGDRAYLTLTLDTTTKMKQKRESQVCGFQKKPCWLKNIKNDFNFTFC